MLNPLRSMGEVDDRAGQSQQQIILYIPKQ